MTEWDRMLVSIAIDAASVFPDERKVWNGFWSCADDQQEIP